MKHSKRKPVAAKSPSAPTLETRRRLVTLRCTTTEYALIADSANQAGLAIGGYLRSLALGSAGPRAVRRPFVDRVALARVLGELGKIGSNINQMARIANATRRPPPASELPAMRADIHMMRHALLQALEREG